MKKILTIALLAAAGAAHAEQLTGSAASSVSWTFASSAEVMEQVLSAARPAPVDWRFATTEEVLANLERDGASVPAPQVSWTFADSEEVLRQITLRD